MQRRFAQFAEFYPYYLSEHRSRGCRVLHFTGTGLAAVLLVVAALTRNPWLVLVALVAGYGFAWLGHWLYEKNRPATFTHPFYSLLGDWVMFGQLLTGRLKF